MMINCNSLFFKFILLFLILALTTVNHVSTLECYVCVDQENNQGKCISTVVTCNYGEDRCLSVIRWGTTPFWEIGAPMQYYISKKCATKEVCESVHNTTIGFCERIEWKDWQCSECCQGDRCNYYITLGSSGLSPSTQLLAMTTFSIFILFRL